MMDTIPIDLTAFLGWHGYIKTQLEGLGMSQDFHIFVVRCPRAPPASRPRPGTVYARRRLRRAPLPAAGTHHPSPPMPRRSLAPMARNAAIRACEAAMCLVPQKTGWCTSTATADSSSGATQHRTPPARTPTREQASIALAAHHARFY